MGDFTPCSCRPPLPGPLQTCARPRLSQSCLCPDKLGCMCAVLATAALPSPPPHCPSTIVSADILCLSTSLSLGTGIPSCPVVSLTVYKCSSEGRLVPSTRIQVHSTRSCSVLGTGVPWPRASRQGQRLESAPARLTTSGAGTFATGTQRR